MPFLVVFYVETVLLRIPCSKKGLNSEEKSYSLSQIPSLQWRIFFSQAELAQKELYDVFSRHQEKQTQ